MKYAITILLFCLFANLPISAQNYLEKGDVLSDFTIHTTDGQEIEIESLRGKVVHLNFFATWCSPCLKELAVIEDKLLNDLEGKDFYFVSIGRDHFQKDIQKFKDKKGYNFPMAYDTQRIAFTEFSEKGIPLNVIINKNGKIIFKETGYSPKGMNQMKRKIHRAL